MKTKKVVVLLTLLIMALMLASCGEQNEKKEETKAKEYFKVKTMDTEVTYKKVPKRVVSFNVHTTENLMALGLTDKIVGISYTNAKVLPKYKKEYDKLKILSDKYPSMEVLLSVNPDFVYGRSSAFGEKGVNTVKGFDEAGIMPYVCLPTYKEGATMKDVYKDFENLGKIFHKEDKAKAVIDEMKNKINGINKKIKDKKTKKVFVFDSGDKDVFTAGSGLETDIIRLAGGRNVFGDKQKTWEHVSWEAVAASNPDYIVINDYDGKTVDEKIAILKSQPVVKELYAVKNNKFIILPLPNVFAGIRNADGVKIIAEGLHPEAFK